MRCPSCNQTNAMKGKFCVHCGQELRPKPAVEVDERAEPANEHRYDDRDYEDLPRHRERTAVEMYKEDGPSVIDGLKDRLQTPEDLSHGQVVIIAARWILVGAGLLLALWNPDALGELRVQIMLILGLAAGNFFLHSQVLMKKPVSAQIAYGASAADIAVISLIVIAAGGAPSGLYVFYFPALLGISVAFRTEVTYTLAGAAMALYGLIAVATMVGGGEAVLVTRLLMMGAVATCGNIYWRTERDRRRAAAETREELLKGGRQEAAAR